MSSVCQKFGRTSPWYTRVGPDWGVHQPPCNFWEPQVHSSLDGEWWWQCAVGETRWVSSSSSAKCLMLTGRRGSAATLQKVQNISLWVAICDLKKKSSFLLLALDWVCVTQLWGSPLHSIPSLTELGDQSHGHRWTCKCPGMLPRVLRDQAQKGILLAQLPMGKVMPAVRGTLAKKATDIASGLIRWTGFLLKGSSGRL